MNTSSEQLTKALRLGDTEFKAIRAFIYERAGIRLNPNKYTMVQSRLERRLRALGCPSYKDYVELLRKQCDGDSSETQIAVDLLTTNETYFFREPKHFQFLEEAVLPHLARNRPATIWSAACSSGEEPYSLAMCLHEHLGSAPWSILATDVSHRMVTQAAKGHYRMERSKHIPHELLKRYCLKGVRDRDGWFSIGRTLRERVTFRKLNLTHPLPDLGMFDVVLLRNVMIYFDEPTKRRVINSIIKHIPHGGYLMLGHSESLVGGHESLEPVRPSIYRRR